MVDRTPVCRCLSAGARKEVGYGVVDAYVGTDEIPRCNGYITAINA